MSSVCVCEFVIVLLLHIIVRRCELTILCAFIEIIFVTFFLPFGEEKVVRKRIVWIEKASRGYSYCVCICACVRECRTYVRMRDE